MNTDNPQWGGVLPPPPAANADLPSIGPLFAQGDDPAQAVPRGFVIRFRDPVTLPDTTSTHQIGFANVCTHMGCRLVRKTGVSGSFSEANRDRFTYSNDGSEERSTCGPCPCHGTTFDLRKEGLAILGPATQNLPMLKLRVTQGGDVETESWVASGHPELEQWGGGLLNFVNGATQNQLEEFNGFGPVIAAAIIAGRKWSDLGDLIQISGISRNRLEEFKEWFDTYQ